MRRDLEEFENEITKIKKKLKDLEYGLGKYNANDASHIVKSLIEEREKTNRMLADLIEKIRKMEEAMADAGQSEGGIEEVPLSDVDAKIIDYIQVRGMACAEDIRKLMGYRGKNAASARLNKLYKQGLLSRLQLGHKVYYKVDAGKAAKMLVLRPPQS
ncbi:MAG: hypothetical protein QXL16_02505 [Candidatus Micrarchaeaceae archaeon]